ncbi:uncharacterized protein K02A2.6-like [Gigantopelta aegis]|uniref:uncharacterized protein K02A2.6-like n=1 Tax=Gigantopelta aegis TaxID=1735272 RepID=UPI001B889EB5|nr:uncharacterized protein K02A2.6-like [Gigantopelta aegis]
MVSNLNISIPASFNFSKPEDWSKWIRRFERFRLASGLAEEEPERQVNTLVYLMGDEADDIMIGFGLTNDEKKDYTTVKGRFDTHFVARRKPIFEHVKFNKRSQQQGENVESFITALYVLVEHCDYGQLRDQMIRDRIVVGVKDDALSLKMQLDDTLTLKKATDMSRQSESVKREQAQLRSGYEEDTSVSTLHTKRNQPDRQHAPYRHSGTQHQTVRKTQRSTSGSCSSCGKDPAHTWNKGVCLAKNSLCSYCEKPGQWIAVCRRRAQVNTVQAENEQFTDTEEVLNIYAMDSVEQRCKEKWLQKLRILDRDIEFRIDIGARCNILTLSDYQLLAHSGELQKSNRILRTYSNHRIIPTTSVELPITHKECHVSTKFEVVDIDQENILSGEVAEEIGLIARLNHVDTNKDTAPQEEFPELVRTTGTLPGKYKIKLQPGAKGVVHAARRQPAALKAKIVDKLNEMTNNGYITRVDQPTEWVSSMGAVVRSDKVCICIDPSDLNKVMLREHHPMKTVEEVVSEIASAQVFSVLNAKSGFLQICLDEESSFLTTFNTPVGRYRWLRLPFGIKSASEIFQRIMDQMLEGISGATAVMDDILVAARTVEEHDIILWKTLAVKDKEGVRRFIGFVTYLAKFIPNLSEEDVPLRQLLKNDILFQWQPAQQCAFDRLKQLCCEPPVLGYFDVNKPVQIQADASQFGLGAVLLQDDRPIAYTSRSLTDAECRYAQIEKEMLSIVHGCVKFHNYILGKDVTVQLYNPTIKYQPGKQIELADTLSRSTLADCTSEVETTPVSMLDFLAISSEKLIQLQNCTKEELRNLIETINSGWPDTRAQLPISLRPYWDVRSEIVVSDGLIFRGMRVVVPPSLRPRMLQLVHESHLSIVKCKQRAREVLYWPCMNADIEETVKNSARCAEFQNKPAPQPLMPTKPPELPYQEVGTDLLYYNGKHYILTILRGDNGLQYKSAEFRKFCASYGIDHQPSSPHLSRSNGEAVQTVKRLWRKNNDQYLALLDYRTTPLDGIDLSPAQLLMGRRPRNKLPTTRSMLQPTSYNRHEVNRRLVFAKVRQKYYYDHSGTRELPPLHPGEHVRIAPLPGTKEWIPGVVESHHSTPRSYVVQSTDGSRYRRNRQHLRQSTEAANHQPPMINDIPLDVSEEPHVVAETPPPSTTPAVRLNSPPQSGRVAKPPMQPPPNAPYVTTRGRVVKPPVRLDM